MKLRKIISAVIVVGAMTFTPQINYLPMVSIAQAAVQTYTGVGEYIGSDDETPAKAKQRAKE